MAVVAFTGTSTGNVYNVGQSYVSAGRVYTAQPDGSFKTTNRDGTVRSVVGSSQSESATFYHSSGSAVRGPSPYEASRSSSSGRSAAGAPRSVVGAPKGTGAGNGVVLSNAGQADMFAQFFAARGFPAGTQFVERLDGTLDAGKLRYPVAGLPNTYLETTAIWVEDELWSTSPKTSDVQSGQQRYGDDNIIVSAGGLAIVGGADAVQGGRSYFADSVMGPVRIPTNNPSPPPPPLTVNGGPNPYFNPLGLPNPFAQ